VYAQVQTKFIHKNFLFLCQNKQSSCTRTFSLTRDCECALFLFRVLFVCHRKTSVCERLNVDAHLKSNTHARNTHTHTHTHTHTCSHTHTQSHTHTRTHMHTHTRAHTHTCTHTSVHKSTHTRCLFRVLSFSISLALSR